MKGNTMIYKNLGKSGLQVSAVCLGTMTFSVKDMFKDYGNTDLEGAKRLVDLAIDNGVNLFDTADSYSGGASEEALGKALGKKRKDVLICTKIRFGGGGANEAGLSRHRIIEGCNSSLERLGTDHIDILLLHAYDQCTPIEETLTALSDLVRQGKVRYIGCSNFAAWEVMKSIAVSKQLGLEKFVTYQAYYSLASREVENEIIPLCLDQGLGVTCWSPLSGGFFTGKYRRGKSKPKSGRRSDPGNVTNIFAPVDEEKGYNIVDVLDDISQKHDASISQVALNYLINKPAVSSVVVGSKKLEHLEENIKSADLNLDKEDMEAIDNVSEPEYPYPYWFKKTIWERDGLRV
jgi:aryl-alcohol dehydrogenase-like predicted oxidoreductase